MKYLYRYIFVLQLILPGCGINDDDQKVLPVEGKIIFEVREEYDEFGTVSPPSIYIKLKTEKIYGCINYGLSTSYDINNNTIEIFLHGVVEPEICLTALGPAATRIKLALSDGVYRVIFREKDFVDEYLLTLNNTFLRIEGDSTENTAPAFSQFNRYPERTFAYLCGTTLADTALCRMFIDTVRSVIKLQPYEFPETGVIPYPLSSQGHYYDMPAQYYSYQAEADFDKINGILQSFKESYIKNSEANIYLINWLNKQYF